jgi:hypothetical protein
MTESHVARQNSNVAFNQLFSIALAKMKQDFNDVCHMWCTLLVNNMWLHHIHAQRSKYSLVYL